MTHKTRSNSFFNDNFNRGGDMRKISQIIECNASIVALCTDGSLWQLPHGSKQWIMLEGIPAESYSIDDLALTLPTKAIANLKKAGIDSIEALIELTKEEVSTLPGVGVKTVFDLENELNNLGLGFKKAQQV